MDPLLCWLDADFQLSGKQDMPQRLTINEIHDYNKGIIRACADDNWGGSSNNISSQSSEANL